MTTQTENRDASATIRGYLYQFDATISAIVALTAQDVLTVEGIEDFDIDRGDNRSELFQCKYYTAQRLTPATIRDAVLPMFRGFVSVDRPLGRVRRYHLYGYFKDSHPCEKKLTAAQLKEALVRRGKTTLSTGITKTEIVDIQKEIGATDTDVRLFAEKLTLHICKEYQEHKNGVVETLQKAFGVSRTEAEDYLYPTALTFVSGVAADSNVGARQVSKAHFFQKVRPKQALYNAWTLREKGESDYCTTIRRRYFSDQNVDALHRFFIIEITSATTNADIEALLRFLRRKWSSHRVRRKPNRERYAPYVYLRDLPPERLVQVKQMLLTDGLCFVDGNAFLGAQFSVDQLCTQQTYENQISLRFLNSKSDLTTTLAGIRGACTIYDFFVNTRTDGIAITQHVVAIPVTSTYMITQIL